MARETQIVERDGVSYEVEPVRYKTQCVGLAATRLLDDKEMVEQYTLAAICELARRQKKQDAKNSVRAKFNRDKVSATAVINAIGTGQITTEMQAKAVELMNKSAGAMNFTEACSRFLGIGEDALKDADPTHIHWDCAG